MIRFKKSGNDPYRQIVPGVEMRPIGAGERTNMVEIRLKKGFTHQMHDHPYEQTGYLISGKLKVTVDGEVFTAEPGDGWSIPANVPHGTEIVEDTVVVEVFSPVREDYL